MDSPSSFEQRALVSIPSCRTIGVTQNARPNRRRVGAIMAAVAAISGGVSLAISQHWLALAAIRPLLVGLPCALIVLLCLRGASPSSKPEPNT